MDVSQWPFKRGQRPDALGLIVRGEVDHDAFRGRRFSASSYHPAASSVMVSLSETYALKYW